MDENKQKTNRKCDSFFKKMTRQGIALSYGDVRLKTTYSEVLPKETNLVSKFSRNISLNIPIVSSPMDTVTETRMAIAMAFLGGIGIIHKSLTPQEQASYVGSVKHYLNAFIAKPVCVKESDLVESVLKMRLKKGYDFFSFPVIDNSGKVVGIVTRNDFDFCFDSSVKISEIMSKEIEQFSLIGDDIDVNTACQRMLENRKKILPVFSKSGTFHGIFTLADVKRIVKGDFKDYNLDALGNLRVGAAVGVGSDLEERLELLSRKNIDVIVIDSAHGDSRAVIDVLKYCKANYPMIDVVVGNISEGASAKRLVDAGADGLRIGQGPGSICTTRIIAGVGCPQVSAIYECALAVRGSGVPICGDGGIEYSGDVSIALAAGADNVMLGKVLAGTEEAPGITFWEQGRQKKVYRGMGSLEAMIASKASRERYLQGENSPSKLVPEGIESKVDYKGNVSDVINQFLGGLRSGLGYLGAKDILSLQELADFHMITGAGLKESHPHGLDYIQNAPNYSIS
ncbi:MAG: IMP dehydrogenase [Candidatus Falkowbacteria bacterium]|nr:IMP dehydrogenase [Candidatus Falkowbacteria bacterium]